MSDMGITSRSGGKLPFVDALKSILGRVMPWFALIAAYVLVAAAGYSGFFLKWALRDGAHNSRLSYSAIKDGTADRPWAYRQLLPITVNALVGAIPVERLQKLEERWLKTNLGSIYAIATDAKNPGLVVNYQFAFFLTFCSFLGALFGLRSLCLHVTKSSVAATSAPMLFALLYPILMTRGGYFYDPIELLMFVLALLFTIHGWWIALIVLAPFAELNKEAFFFFLFTLIPLVPHRTAKLKGYGALAIAGALSLCSYAMVRHAFAQNPGGSVEFHLLENLRFYIRPSSYFGFESTYGLSLPRGVSLFYLALLASLVTWGWPRLPAVWKRHIGAALAVNLPLFMLFAWGDELRNLSLLFAAFTVLIACALKTLLERAAMQAAETQTVN